MNKWLIIFLFFYSAKSFGQITYYGGKSGEKFDHFIYYLENYYVEDTDEDSLTDLAIRHALTALDRFSTYQTIEESQAQLNADKGFNPKGSGFDFYNYKNSKFIVNYVAPDGPAEKVGIQVHDQLIRINDIELNLISRDSIYKILNGGKDTLSVVYKKHSGVQKTVQLVKTLLPYSSIASSYMLTDNVGYIKMVRFTANTETEFVASIKRLKEQGIESLVLDLRGNPGGVKSGAIAFTDHFIGGDKLISYSEGGHFLRQDSHAEIDGEFEEGKLVVLTDNVTASASELFAVAVQDWDRGVIMGEETFGKGLIQQSYTLNDGSTVRLTIAKYYSPTGRLIQKAEYKNWIESVSNLIPPSGRTAKSIFSPDNFGQTQSGRKILTGKGGVIPDLYFKKDVQLELNNWSYFQQGYVYDFALHYSFVQRNILLKRYFTANELKSDSALNNQIDIEFRNYLVSKNFNEAKNKDFSIPEGLFVKVKAWISSLLWDNAAYHEVNNTNDVLIERAINLLENREEYRELLQN